MQTPNKITLDIIKLNDMLKSFESKNDIADFVVKAVDDLVNGCKSDNVDERVMAVFKENLTSMRIRQNRSERYNQKRKLAEGSASGIATDEVRTGFESEAVNTESNKVGQTTFFSIPVAHAETSPVRVDCGEMTESSRSEKVSACGKQRYGTHKHVLLNVEEGTKLREIFGKNLRAAIEILDNYIHSLPSKKAKDLKNGAKWWREQYEAKDHYLCMTRWVRKTLNEMQTSELNRMTAENRFSRSKTAPMSFAQMERERTARALRGESIDGKDYVRDEDLTTEEFEAKYG